jgi:hypothetical protein
VRWLSDRRVDPPRRLSTARSRLATAGNGAQGRSKLADQLAKWLHQCYRSPDDYDDCPARNGLPRGAIRRAKASPDPVTINRAPDLSAHREPSPGGSMRSKPEHDQPGPVDPFASLEERLKFGAGGQPLTSREAARYAIRRLRPFARRRLSTFRPPCVFIRWRKPCVLARRRRFGWNVRFMREPFFRPIVEPTQCRHLAISTQEDAR